MSLEHVEQQVRQSGALAAAAFLSTVFAGLACSLRRPLGRVSGPAPAGLRASPAFYLAATAVFFGGLRLLWRPLPLSPTPRAQAGALILGTLLYFPGLALALWGRLVLGKMYGMSTSLGAQLYADHRLVTSGPFALVRHPMYLGAQLAALGALLLYRTWAALFLAATFPGLALRARREEAVLAAEFGAQWEAYCRRVPALLPRIRRNRPRSARGCV